MSVPAAFAPCISEKNQSLLLTEETAIWEQRDLDADPSIQGDEHWGPSLWAVPPRWLRAADSASGLGDLPE